MCAVVLHGTLVAGKQAWPCQWALQVPNMQLYIQKWGRRVGFDLNVQPSDEALTHAIIQVLLGAEMPHPASAQHAPLVVGTHAL